jgi:SAM-dependent methyltransferase
MDLSNIARLVGKSLVGAAEWNLRRNIRSAGGRLPADMPQVDWINAVLKTRRQIDEALREVDRCGLVRHPDRAKNWDALAAIKTILMRTGREARVLEMGARLYSVILPWLYQYGYRHLTGIDVVYDEPVRRGPIRYEFGDLRKTHFTDRSFDVICSLSVIEHGVEPRLYFAEAARLLTPGGLLITSTDCWKEPVDTRGQVAYDAPIKIFTIEEIADMIRLAADQGFTLLREMDLVCEEAAVTWGRYRLEYTFVCFALIRQDLPRRRGAPPR